MPRPIDHVVIAARDLEALAGLYRRLGFQVGVRNRHPWGTENHIVQFDGCFLELIGLGEDFETPEPLASVYSFGGSLASFLQRRQGMAMIALRSHDAEADRIAFSRAGIGDFARFDFGRKGRGPDGAPVDVAFSLAYAQAQGLEDAGFFVSQHHFPENFWSAKAQVHPNGARSIAGVVLANERPQDHVAFLKSFAGSPEAQPVDGGFAAAGIEILAREAIVRRYGAEALEDNGPPLAILRLGVDDIGAARTALEKSGAAFKALPRALVAPASQTLGLTIVFENAAGPH